MGRDIGQRQFSLRTPFLWNTYRTRLGTVRIDSQTIEIIATPRLGYTQNMQSTVTTEHVYITTQGTYTLE